MARHGLHRLPYYPQLSALFDNRHGAHSLVLSALLYWNTRDEVCRFTRKAHTWQLALHLHLEVQEVAQALNDLQSAGFLYEVHERFLKKKDPGKPLDLQPDTYEERTFLRLDLKVLSERMQQAGIEYTDCRVLEHAADDFFDLYDVINPERLPLIQGIRGSLSGQQFFQAGVRAACVASYLAWFTEDLVQHGVAPGWRMLLQPPALPADIVTRWMHEGEHGIDLEFGDGTFFMPDGADFGAAFHYCTHRNKAKAPRTVAAAFMLAIASVSEEVSFVSDLKVEELKEAFALLYAATGIKGRLDEAYFARLHLSTEEKAQLQEQYARIIQALLAAPEIKQPASDMEQAVWRESALCALRWQKPDELTVERSLPEGSA